MIVGHLFSCSAFCAAESRTAFGQAGGVDVSGAFFVVGGAKKVVGDDGECPNAVRPVGQREIPF
jgi:hypothetical protein